MEMPHAAVSIKQPLQFINAKQKHIKFYHLVLNELCATT